MKIKNSLGLPAAIFAVFVWGISFICTKVVLRDLPPVTIAFFRQFVALIPLLILMVVKKENLRIKKAEYLIFALSSLFGIVLYFFFENKGLALTSASNASMLVAAIPIFALIAESVTCHKKISIPSLICIITSIAGVYLVIFEGKAPDFQSETFVGSLLVFGAVISWIVYTFLSSRLSRSYSSLKMTTIQTIMSIPLFVPFIIKETNMWRIPSMPSILNLIFLGVFCSALAYVFYLFGLQNLGPVVVSALLNLIPVVTIIADSVMLHVMISFHQAIGATLILGSLSFLSLRKAKLSRHKIIPAHSKLRV